VLAAPFQWTGRDPTPPSGLAANSFPQPSRGACRAVCCPNSRDVLTVLGLEITLSCFLLWYCVDIYLHPQFNIIPPIQSVECLQRKYFIISFDIHESPLGEVQQQPTFADELRLRGCGSWTHLFMEHLP